MPCRDFVDARIVVNDQPLEEYQDPDNDDDVRYVQAIAGQTFGVEVKILPGFQLHRARHLCFEFQIVDVNRYCCCAGARQSLPHRKGVLTKEVKHQHNGSRVKKDDGQWTIASLTFGALGIGKRVIRRTTDHWTDAHRGCGS